MLMPILLQTAIKSEKGMRWSRLFFEFMAVMGPVPCILTGDLNANLSTTPVIRKSIKGFFYGIKLPSLMITEACYHRLPFARKTIGKKQPWEWEELELTTSW